MRAYNHGADLRGLVGLLVNALQDYGVLGALLRSHEGRVEDLVVECTSSAAAHGAAVLVIDGLQGIEVARV